MVIKRQMLILVKIPNILLDNNIDTMAKKEKTNLNRVRIILAERDKTNRWLADQLGVTEGTISKWVTNNHQPPLERLYEISLIFKIDIRDLIESTLPRK